MGVNDVSDVLTATELDSDVVFDVSGVVFDVSGVVLGVNDASDVVLASFRASFWAFTTFRTSF